MKKTKYEPIFSKKTMKKLKVIPKYFSKSYTLIDFSVLNRGFRIDYIEKGTPKCKEDKYWIYFIDKKKEILLGCFREDECILLSALLNFAVHKKLVEIDKVGCDAKIKTR